MTQRLSSLLDLVRGDTQRRWGGWQHKVHKRVQLFLQELVMGMWSVLWTIPGPHQGHSSEMASFMHDGICRQSVG